MNGFNPNLESNLDPIENEKPSFGDKFRDLLPGVEFNEPTEMSEARTAVIEALTRNNLSPDLLLSIWIEYTKICHQLVDARSNANPDDRAQLQIAIIVHKALIFREIEDIQHYGKELSDAEEYAHNMYLDEIAEVIGRELDNLMNHT